MIYYSNDGARLGYGLASVACDLEISDLPHLYEVMDNLAKTSTFEVWGTRGEKSPKVRFVTSWATKKEDVDDLINELPG